MVKLLGISLILFSSCCTGLSAANWIEKNIRVLRSWQRACAALNREISGRMIPLNVIFHHLSVTLRKPVSEFFQICAEGFPLLGEKSLSELWRKALADTPEQNLDQDMMCELMALGDVLGRYDWSEQREALLHTEQMLESQISVLQAKLPEQKKICRTIGISAGIFASILLW